jgi:hypothetical protein
MALRARESVAHQQWWNLKVVERLDTFVCETREQSEDSNSETRGNATCHRMSMM